MWSFISTWAFSRQAAEAGAELLKSGGRAMDAVIDGIHRVESDPEVDCVGRGGFLNEKGELALDAAVMDGDTLKTGAVCAVRGFEHPVDIARALMDKTRHNILVGEGAEEFARKMGIPESAISRIRAARAEITAPRSVQAAGSSSVFPSPFLPRAGSSPSPVR